MASASKTPNLNLPQWVGTEKPERTDFNAAFDVLDEEVGDRGKSITWTPVLRYYNQTTAPTYTVLFAKYAVVGNLVFFQLSVNVSAIGTGTTAIQITGLPVSPSLGVPCSIKISLGATTVRYCQLTSSGIFEPLTDTFGNVVVWETKIYTISGFFVL